MYLTVSPIKGVTRFGKSRKLSMRYVSPFENLKKVGELAYKVRYLLQCPKFTICSTYHD